MNKKCSRHLIYARVCVNKDLFIAAYIRQARALCYNFNFLELYMRLHTLPKRRGNANTNANARRKTQFPSVPCHHGQFNQDEVDVFRHCGNFLCFSTEFFFSCASKHVKTTNILVPYRGILKERKLCELEQHFKPFTFLRVVLQILYCALSGSW